MSEVPQFKEDKYIDENQPDRLEVSLRNNIQIEILKILGFRDSGEKTQEEHDKENEWILAHRSEISNVIDESEHGPEIRKLARSGEITEAAKRVIEILGLSR